MTDKSDTYNRSANQNPTTPHPDKAPLSDGGGRRADLVIPSDLSESVRTGRVKALSIKQPYPHHIFHDGKDVENRDWPTKGRGWFIVHAGVSKSELDMEDEHEAAMPRGGVVGMARIIACVQSMESKWFFGRYGFVLRDAFPLTLIPCRGQLGFFNLDAETCSQVADAVAALSKATGGQHV